VANGTVPGPGTANTVPAPGVANTVPAPGAANGAALAVDGVPGTTNVTAPGATDRVAGTLASLAESMARPDPRLAGREARSAEAMAALKRHIEDSAEGTKGHVDASAKGVKGHVNQQFEISKGRPAGREERLTGWIDALGTHCCTDGGRVKVLRGDCRGQHGAVVHGRHAARVVALLDRRRGVSAGATSPLPEPPPPSCPS